MKTIAKPPQILEQLKSFETFNAVPDDALNWLISKSNYIEYEKGEVIFFVGKKIDVMQVIMKGSLVVESEKGGKKMELGVYNTGYVTGKLPFSRMVSAGALGKALEDTYILELHESHFVEMVNTSYKLTQNLVAQMSNRIRSFSQLRYQTEKLSALGRMSAGLAHELNNPASAIVRDVSDLYKRIHNTPEKFKQVITMRVTDEETDQINEILFSKIHNLNEIELSLLEREEQKDDLTDWLEDHGIEDGEDIADTFVEFGITEEDLDNIDEIVGGRYIPPLMNWIESTLSLEKLVNDIKESSERIASLIKAVKSYTHMDQAHSKEPANIHHGIKNTLIMLKHKLKQKQIEVVKEFNKELPLLPSYVGELNQVWTNLFDNAIDAMPEKGQLTLKTYRERQYLCVEVSDNGKGIDEEDITRIFEPFFTTKGVGQGTGLGLEITKKIVERHNGTIGVTSQPGKTTFKLCFPLTD
ncbi:MAG: ATP-binding protein [Bacteroidota bacterium]